MRAMLKRLLLLVLILALAGCAADEQTPALVDPTGFVTYTHPSGVFTLSLPSTWVVSDQSDTYAISTGFSPPDAPQPLASVYIASLTAFDPALTPGALPELNRLADLYTQRFYTLTDATVKPAERTPQPDGSLRLSFIVDAPQGTTQHNDFVQVNGPYVVVLRTLLPGDPAQLRTLARVVNTLSVNATAGWASALDEEAGGAPRNLIDFASLNGWVDRSGGFVIAGQVVNNAPEAVEFVRVNARLFDAEGRVLLERDNFVSSDLVKPGERAPFSIVFSDGLPPGTVRYDLETSGRYADDAAQTFYGPENFALTSQAAFDEDGLLVISGQVRNEGTRAADLVKVIVVIFDEQQRVTGTDTTLVDMQRLAPGETSTYSVSFFELGGSASTFLVTAQGIVAGE